MARTSATAERILDAKTVRSRIMGSGVWGSGIALHGEALIDQNFGRIVNVNIADHHVAVNADIRDVEVFFVDEPDDIINPLGINGVGEIDKVGTATGQRVPDLPISLDELQR